MLDGITDILNVIGSMTFEYGFMPNSNGEGNITQSKELARKFIEHVKIRREKWL